MIGSLFSGIGGLELGLERATGMGVAWQVEIDPWCRKVLAKHWPDAKRFEDVRSVGKENLAPTEIICGGFPCQDVSVAGRGAGLEGRKSGLWFEFLRIVGEMRPRFVIVENVASGARKWVRTVEEGLAGLGYRTRAFSISAFDVGAPHRRKRVFIVANRDGQQLRHGPEREAIRRVNIQAKGESFSFNVGAQRVASNPDGLRELEPGGHIESGWRWSRNGVGWTIEPPVCGVAHGVPRRMDKGRRLKALGNAVVPQCAEAIGRML